MYEYVALGLVLMAACGGSSAFNAWAVLSNKGILEPSSSTLTSGDYSKVAMATTDAYLVGGV